MAETRNSSVSYQGDGIQTKYSFPFDYLRKAFVKVQLVDGDSRQDLTQGTDYTVNDREITLNSPTEKIIYIYRDTGLDPLVTWSDASVLRAQDMNIQEVQLFHIVGEAKDMLQDNGMAQDDEGNWNGRYHQIKNILSPTEANDVVTKSYFDDAKTGVKNDRAAAETAANKAETNQVKAAVSEVNAKTSETKAKTSETNAKTSETNAKNSEIASKTSETNAANSESNAASSASSASESATNAKNSELLAQKWAESSDSPDNQEDEDSITGETMSSKEWAKYAKEIALNLKNPVSDISLENTQLKVNKTDGSSYNVDFSKVGKEIVAENKDPSYYQYVRFSNGLQEVWGYSYQQAYQAYKDVTFNVPFSQYPIVFATIRSEYAIPYTGQISTSINGTTGCRIFCREPGGGQPPYDVGFYFHAIGWWK